MSQLSYPALRNTVEPSPSPAPPGDNFELPPVARATNINAPACAEWTRTAGPDESVVITGNNFSQYKGADQGKDTRFKVYAENGFVKDAAIQMLDEQKTVITLDKDIPKWSMYLVWPLNQFGYGNPIAINKTDAWWIGPEKGTRGAVTSVFGRNLACNNDTITSNIYIKKAGAAGQWATVTRVNPYKVDFVIPATLDNGDYEVWVHNGHGGEYGWSGPLTLSIYTDFHWDSTVINVMEYGASGDGTTDDTQPIKSAISAASKIPGSTVFFPVGSYVISNTIVVANDLKIIGADKLNTVIKCGSSFSNNASGMLAGNVSNFVLENISFETDGNFHGEYTNPISLRGSSYITIQNVNLFFQGYDVINLDRCYRVFMKNCQIIGKTSFLGSGSQIFIDSSMFKLTNDAEAAIGAWGGVGVSMTNSACQDYDNSDPTNGAGWGKGRFFSSIGNFGSSRCTYIGNNTTNDLAVRPALEVDQNSGEQFMWEGFYSDWAGSPITSTDSTTTLKGFSASYENTHFAVVIKGKGLGQSRQIIGYNGFSISLENPWNVIPDTSSVIALGNFIDKVVLYKNFIDGKASAVISSSENASSGIQPFGGTSNFIADNNTIKEVRTGIANWETQINAGLDPNFFSYYVNNKISDCRWGILNALHNNTTHGTGIVGTTFRRNLVNNTLQSGIIYAVLSPDTAVLDANLLEHNIFQNLANGLSTGGDDGLPSWIPSDGNGIQNQVLYKNNFESTSATSKSHGIMLLPKLSLRENIYQGFDSIYKGPLFGAVIEAPYHVIEILGSSGGKVIESTFALYNSGSSRLRWNASSNSPWLTIPSDIGTIEDEASVSNIKLYADPAGLAVGTYVGYITINSENNSKIFSVLFTVTDNKDTDYFQSKNSGDWADVNNWQSSADSISWIDAKSIPSSRANSVAILNSHTITITDTVSVDQLFVQDGGVLNVAPNASIVIDDGVGDDISIGPLGSLVIQSDSTGTGRIGNSAGTILGNVTVERYISSTANKTYRLLSPSVNTLVSPKPFIRDNWQEGQNNTSLNTNSNLVPYHGIQITGSTTGANGFDATSTGTPSLFTYNPGSMEPFWLNVPNTNATNLEAKKGYLVLIRGDRDADLETNQAASSTTLRATGQILTGTQVFTKPESNRRNVLIGNPYPSPINWSTAYNDTSTGNSVNFENYYTYWDTGVGFSGGYVTVNSNGIKSAPSNATTEIKTGQAFLISVKKGITSPVFTIKESHKSFTSNLNIFRNIPSQQFMSTLYFTTSDGTEIMADAVNAVFNDHFSNSVDDDDAEEVPNWAENIAINRGGIMLSIEARSFINNKDTLPLNIQRLKAQNYEWKFDALNFRQQNLQAYLYDKYLDKRTPISLTSSTTIPFMVNLSPASFVEDRFQVIFNPENEALPLTTSNLKAFQNGIKIQLNWDTPDEVNTVIYEIEKSINGINFARIATIPINEVDNSIKSRTWLDDTPLAGNNFYRIKTIDQFGLSTYSSIVNVIINNGKRSFDVYPNPLSGDYSTIEFNNIPKGIYSIKLINSTGQTIIQKTISHNGGSGRQSIHIDSHLPGGNYIMLMSGYGICFYKHLIK